MKSIAEIWKTTRGKLIIIGSGLIFVCICCVAVSMLPSPRANNAAPEAAASEVIEPTNTPRPTNTVGPTDTPAPTDTPEPTATSTPPPEPIVLTGTGDSIVDVPKGDYPAIMRAKHAGGSNFIVTTYDGSNDMMDVLINTIGVYEGTRPLDFFIGEQTARLEIKAGGAWEITILPVFEARRATAPGPVQGVGDDVVYIDGENLDTLTADASQGSANFIVFSYSDNGSDLVINEIAPYTGTVLLDNTTYMISVQATGPWSLDITTR